MKLSTTEQQLLDDSYNDTMKTRRLLFVCVDAILAVLVVLALPLWNASPGVTSLVFVAYLLVSAVEKLSYARVINGYKILVRRFVDRAEDLYHHPERIADEHRAQATSRPSNLVAQRDVG